MIRTLTLPERRAALALAGLLALLGLMMGMGARQGVMAIHGAIAAALGLALVIGIAGALDDPEPGPDRLSRYYDAPTRTAAQPAAPLADWPPPELERERAMRNPR